MVHPPASKDIRGQFILLGTGTSVGVPVIGCDCPVCTGGQPRNQRTRSAVIAGVPGGNLLIDTPPDLIGNLAYRTDTNQTSESGWALPEGLDTLVLDALRDRPHPRHFSLEQAITLAERVQPRRAIFTHISHELDHDTINARLPPSMELATTE